MDNPVVVVVVVVISGLSGICCYAINPGGTE